ncbi:MAG: hypothetical protein WC729_10485 [Sphingomonas sp.]|uniref:hypothetical protein n=1 Tax=Sphingomonas sp. TaxID=28214 RepID=UPI00356172AD
MKRPRSILMFERFYLAAFVINVVSIILAWPLLRFLTIGLGRWYLPVSTAIGFAIPLLLWFFIAWRGSVIAKWIATVLVAFGVIIAAITLLSIGSRDPIRTAFAIVQPILQIAAIWFLFRPDTPVWFGEKPAESV